MPKNNTVIFVDFETNGRFSGHSVLSVGAIKVNFISMKSWQYLSSFYRFYYPLPGQTTWQGDGEFNALTMSQISKKREGKKYSLYYRHDTDFKSFCAGCRKIVAHNVSFDRIHMPYKKCKFFCTMKKNTEEVKARWLESRKKWKWPTLEETAIHYNVSFDQNKFHDALYDAKIMMSIFMTMFKQGNKNVLNFLELA